MATVVYVRLSADEWLVSSDRKQWSILRDGGEAVEALEQARGVFPQCLVAILGECPAASSGICSFCPGSPDAAS
jgi:hypothetical protein